jgi:hypothetical protein
VRLVGIAETNNGPIHPDPAKLEPHGALVNMDFMIANDWNLSDQFLPINFVWFACPDNAFSDFSGNEMYVDIRIFNAEDDLIWDEEDDVTYPESERPFGLGTPDYCFGGGKTDPIRCIEFYHGGVKIIHKDSIDLRGDINLNGVAYEIADAVVFSNYFVYGLGVFEVNVQGQIAATDINADGVTLTVADLVLLIRIIIGDADPIPKVSPYTEEAIVSTTRSGQGIQVAASTPGEIGAALFVFDLEQGTSIGEPQLSEAAADMDVLYAVKDGELRVLVWNMGTERVAAGHSGLMEIPVDGGALRLTSTEIVDYQGVQYECLLKGSELPGDFRLSQNYPNPFNPRTTILFSLPEPSDWTLKVFNITGKLVREFAGSSAAGTEAVTWEGLDQKGRPVASGVYFYRLEAGQFSDTKKMVLLK